MYKRSKTIHFIDRWATLSTLHAAAEEQARDGSFAEETLIHDLRTARETLDGLREGSWLMPAGKRRYRFTAVGLETVENLVVQ